MSRQNWLPASSVMDLMFVMHLVQLAVEAVAELQTFVGESAGIAAADQGCV